MSLAARSTPPALVQKMHDALATALRTPEVSDKLAQSDQSVVADSPAEASARLAQDTQRWGEVARRIQLRLD